MITNETIQLVMKQYTRAGKISAKKIKDYLTKYEPEFSKYLDSSTWDDVKSLIERYNIPYVKEIIDGISSAIVGGKIEGYLIHSIAQDKFWNHKYGLDITGELKPEDKFKLFLDGMMDPSNYNYKLTEEEEKDPTHFKKIALDNFKKNQEKLRLENELNSKKTETTPAKADIKKVSAVTDLLE